MAYKNKYHDDSDADDEYERSVVSPALPLDYEESSPTDSGPLSAEHTPTTFTHSRDSKGSPTGLISEWTAEQTRDFISELGLGKYATKFVDEGITGEALVALQPEDLKELNVNSLGHRLTILKAVYEIKVKQNVPMDPDHYIPLSADTSAQEAPPTQEDLAHVIRVLQNRDEEIQMIKSELRHSKDDLSRLLDENRKLREEFLPLVRMLKDSQQPLPTPNEHVTSPPAQQERAGSSLSRKFSTKKLFLGSAPKNPSPTIHEGRTLVDNTNLDPSAAALAASSHLTASMTGGQQMSPNSAPQPSPTSPAYSQNQNRAYNRSDMPRSGHPDHETTPSWPNTNTWASDSTAVSDRNRDMRNNTPAPLSSRPMRNNAAPTPDPNDRDREPPLSGGMNSSSSTLQNPPSSAPAQTPSSNPQVEIFKSFRVSIDDPCHKVLPVALKKYNITADWRQYALYIVHGDQERCLGLNERPLILFKQLDKEGRKPMFMLRKHAAPAEGHVSTVGGGDVRSVGTGGGFGWDGGNRGVQLPGGVLLDLFEKNDEIMEVLDARLKAKGHNELHDALAREELFIPMKVTFEGEEYFLMKLLTEADYQNLMSRRMERAQKLQAGKAPQMNVYLRWMNKYASEKNTHIPQIHRQASQFYNPLSQFHGKVPQFRNQAPQFSIQDPQFRCQVLRFRSQIEPFYNLRQQFSKPVPERFNQGAQFYKWVPKNPQFKPVSISVGRATGGNEDDTGKAKSSSPPTARASSPAPAIRVATPISTVYVASPIPTTLSSLPTTPTRDVSPNATIPAISPPLAMRGSSLIPPMRTASSAPVSRPSSSALVPRTPPVALIYGDRPIPVSTRSAPARVLLVYNVWTPPAEWADPALRTTPRVPLLSHVLPTSVPDSPVKPKGLRGRLCWNRGSNTT